MSYCRFSSDNFHCDLYCYEDCSGGFTTHVAAFRQRLWLSVFEWLTDKRLKITENHSIRVSRFKTYCWPHWLTHRRIRLQHAGATFNDDTEEEMFARIDQLSRLGFHVPAALLEMTSV